jgi:hypothetical protein
MRDNFSRPRMGTEPNFTSFLKTLMSFFEAIIEKVKYILTFKCINKYYHSIHSPVKRDIKKKSKTANFYCIVDYAHWGHHVKKKTHPIALPLWWCGKE